MKQTCNAEKYKNGLRVLCKLKGRKRPQREILRNWKNTIGL